MKRYIAILAMALVAASCMRGDYMDEPDIVGGRSVINNQEARTYMMYIADNLITDVLEELELALNISERGMEKSAHFTIDKRLTTVGATWTVKADDSHLNGLTLHCDAADTWTFTFSGNYVFGSEENDYPTTLSMKAVKYMPEDEEDTALGWVVSLSGERKEWKDNQKQGSSVPKSAYSCTFQTYAGSSLRYLNTRGRGATGWNQMYGDLYMDVYKAGEKIDVCCLSFEGSPAQATFIRGL